MLGRALRRLAGGSRHAAPPLLPPLAAPLALRAPACTLPPLLLPLLPASARCWVHARGFAASGAAAALHGLRQPAAAAMPLLHSAGAHARGYAKAPQKGGKMKLPSSFKERFKRTANGHFMRMRVGKRHCASAKSRPQRRRLRKKALVPAGRAAVMRKLGFAFRGSGR